MNFIAKERREFFIRWVLALFVAPMLPLFFVAMPLFFLFKPEIVVYELGVGNPVVLMFALAIGYVATWIFSIPLYLILEKSGIRSLAAYLFFASSVGVFFTIPGFPDLMAIGFSYSFVTGFGVWCALWIGRRNVSQ